MPSLFVQPPLAGISRKFGFQAQPPFSAYDSVNFWPVDAVTGRKVLATRPPLVALTDTLDGSTVNCLERVNGDASQSPQETIVAAAGGTLYYWDGEDWTEVEGDGTPAAIDTGRPVYAAAYLKKVFFALEDTRPAVFDYDDLSLEIATASAGTMPTDCRLVMTWAGCLWLAGNEANPHVFSCSATGDPLDWDSSDESEGGAFTSTGDNEGLINQPLTAMFPLSSDKACFAGRESLWVMLRHPRRGGVLENISNIVGILGQGAWCKDDRDVVYFLGKNGLYTLDPRTLAVAPVSKEKIPDELLNVSSPYLNPTISMAYDSRWNGIIIAVRGDDQQAWWYDLETGGFHRMMFASYPHVMCRFDPIEAEGQSGVLFGGAGYSGVSRFDTTGSEDLHYYVVAGPVKLSASVRQKSKINFAQFLFSGNTTADADTHVNIWGGATPEDAVHRYLSGDKTFHYTRTLETMLANGGRCRPQVSGAAALIEIVGNGEDKRVVWDGVHLDMIDAGRVLSVPSILDPTNDPAAIFNPSRWALYAQATLPLASTALTGFSHYVDLSRLPTAWWDAVRPDGGDIRVTGSTNQLLPYDLVAFSKTNKTGFLVVKQNVATATGTTRIYAGNTQARAPGSSSSIGRFNAYDSDVKLFVPHGFGTDRTSNGADIAAKSNVTGPAAGATVNAPTQGDGATLVGIASTNYASSGDSETTGNLVTDYAEYHDDTGIDVTAATMFATVKPVTLAISQQSGFLSAIGHDSTDAGPQYDVGLGLTLVDTNEPVAGLSAVNSDLDPVILHEYVSLAETSSSIGSALSTGTTYAFAATSAISTALADLQRLYVNGVAAALPSDNSEFGTDLLPAVDVIRTVAIDPTGISMTIGGNSFDVALVRVDGVRRSATYIARVAAMNNQSTFWGTWTVHAP